MAAESPRLLAAAGQKTRVQNVTAETTIKASPGILHRIILSNANAAAQTLTVTDGAAVVTVLRVPAATAAYGSQSITFEARFDTSIKVTPSAVEVDAVIVWD